MGEGGPPPSICTLSRLDGRKKKGMMGSCLGGRDLGGAEDEGGEPVVAATRRLPAQLPLHQVPTHALPRLHIALSPVLELSQEVMQSGQTLSGLGNSLGRLNLSVSMPRNIFYEHFDLALLFN